MSRRLVSFLAFIILISLACNMTSQDETPESTEHADDSGGIEINGPSELALLRISPTTGSGEFTVSVGYVWRMGDENYTIDCIYPDPQGIPYTYRLPLTHTEYYYPFTLTMEIPGGYTVWCMDSAGTSMSAAFTVPVLPTVTVENFQDRYTHAEVTFDLAQITLLGSAPTGGSKDVWLTGYCWPPQDPQHKGNAYLRVGPDGDMEGECYVTTDTDNVHGSLTGTFYQTAGTVTFTLITSAAVTGANPSADSLIKSVTYTAQGVLNGDNATGTAEFTVTCHANGNMFCLDQFQDLEFDGWVPFTVTFIP